ncbi:MAG: DNA mismatch repair protein MutS [Clostridiaceae bacterium]|nr:DNA mismatch repair protein MutS [Clostridiaceae bacterium]
MAKETLRFTPPENEDELTPMMRQYLAFKRQYPGTILMFHIGDFYEMFFEDAKTVTEELELTLTGKSCGPGDRAAMCGVPCQTVDTYVGKLIEHGHRVAICEQTEDPALAKGLVERDVLRVVTPGTVIDAGMLKSDANNYLGAVFSDAGGAGVAFCDISTGQAYVTELDSTDVIGAVTEECSLFSPKEMLLSDSLADSALVATLKEMNCLVSPAVAWRFEADDSAERVAKQFPDAPVFADAPRAVRALSAVLTYLSETQKTALNNLRTVERYTRSQYMILDTIARRNLELFETLRGHEKKGSLLWVLDQTETSMGARCLRRWMEQPLTQPAAISRRANAVELLCAAEQARRDLREILGGVQDLERLISRVALGRANARDLQAIGSSSGRLPELKTLLAGFDCALLETLHDELDPLEDIAALIAASIADNPPIPLHDGGLIRTGYHAEVDELRTLVSDSRVVIADIETRERERTGIRTLRVGYNRVFGYYIEVSRTASESVPEDYIRRQTLVGSERYITPELKDLETRVLTAKDRITTLEYEVFSGIRDQVAAATARIQATAAVIAQVDVLLSFAQVAVRNNYRRPEVNASDVISITEGRHPVVEQIIGRRAFIANDTLLDCGKNRMAIITGPNMAGKSTYMRQTALIVLMAQLGSFVPAASAKIGVTDRIFTRVGASDDLSSGQSTFMVEMSEVAQILRGATRRSLLILDEIGRGTSTYDGMSIARAVVEYIIDRKKLGARTMFATHYHELTVLSEKFTGVVNYATTVKRRGEELTFLRRIIPGHADESYGIEVARLAGLPDGVIRRAREILRDLEEDGAVYSDKKKPSGEASGGKASNGRAPQVSLADLGASDLVRRVRGLNLDDFTPMQALNMLYELKSIAEKLP